MFRTMVFVDYWNLQLTLQNADGAALGLDAAELAAHRFDIDWFALGSKLTRLASEHAAPTDVPLLLDYMETRVYTSSDPNDGRFKGWANNVLGRKPSIRVECIDRRPKRHRKCSTCHAYIDHCSHCNAPIVATEEKGVDTHLVTDLLRFGLDNAYDVALLVSQDYDMAPAARHLAAKGIKVIQVGIQGFGEGLAKAGECWSKFDLFPLRSNIRRV